MPARNCTPSLMRGARLAAIAVLLSACAPARHATAQDMAAQPAAAPGMASRDSSRSAADLFASDVIAGFRHAGSVATAPARYGAREWAMFASACVATAAAAAMDEPLRAAERRAWNAPASDVLQVGRFYGDVVTGGAIAGGLYIVGLAAGEDGLRETGAMLGEALLFSGLVTTALKSAVARSRPSLDDGAWRFDPLASDVDHTAFPSGHATVAFALSGVLARRIDHPVATALLYLLASATAVQRVYDDRHWASDVVAGALIGTATAAAVLRAHARDTEADGTAARAAAPGGAAPHAIVPRLTAGPAGIGVAISF